MIEELGPYPAYKDSGLPGLGELPAHWRAPRLKNVFREIDRRSGTGTQPLLSLKMREGLVDYHEAGGKPIAAADLTHYKVAEPGELVMNRMRAASGLFGLPPKVGLVSPDYAVLRPRKTVNLRYFLDLFRSTAMTSIFRLQSHGLGTGESGFLRLYTEQFGMIHAPLPPSDEQASIVRFLDYADRCVGRYIAAKKRLIALLAEQKQATLNRAVTRGVNPDVRLKPSGVEWLGEIPAHWTVSRVKSEFECLDRRRVPLNGPERGAMTRRDYDYYGASGVIDRVESFLFDDDLLLIAEDGANLVLRHLPLAIVAHGRFWVNNHAHILRPKRGNLDYLAALMETLNYKPWISGAAQPKLTQDRLMSIAIAVPFRDEQDQIMASIKDETASLRLAIDHARREIDFVREFRTRLIADVVTGKADVREAAAGLPAEIEEAELVDDIDSIEDIEFETDAGLGPETEEVGV